MGRNLIESIMGGVVLLVAGFFLAFAYTNADLRQVQGYELRAEFSSIGGLEQGADVRINGIKVGTVIGHALDPVTFNAVVRMTITPEVRLPEDTVATIASDGLLGGKFLKLEPGRSAARLPESSVISRTRDFKSIEEMVGELIFLATADGTGTGGGSVSDPTLGEPGPDLPDLAQ